MLGGKQSRSREMSDDLEYECKISGPGDAVRNRATFTAPTLDAAKKKAREWAIGAAGIVPEPTQLTLMRDGAHIWAIPLAEFP